MKLTKEIKTAVLVLSSILLFIVGYGFLKGNNVFSSDRILYAKYQNVEGLPNAAPVTINGLTIGKVTGITLSPENGELTVKMLINADFPISSTSIAKIYEPGFIGGKQIAIIPDFSNKKEVKSGDFITGTTQLGLTANIEKQLAPLQTKINSLIDNADLMLKNVNGILDTNTQNNIKTGLASLQLTLAQMEVLTKNINQTVANNQSKIDNSLSNVEKMSANFNKVSEGIAKANTTEILQNIEKITASLQLVITNLQQGKGTAGKLMNDDQMYQNINATSKELELLLQDLRLHPTRYINVSLFGKKEKPYQPTTK